MSLRKIQHLLAPPGSAWWALLSSSKHTAYRLIGRLSARREAREPPLPPEEWPPLDASSPGLGLRVRQLYAHRRDIRERFPLALTPAGRRRFVNWLRRAVLDPPLRPEEIAGFLHESATDPSAGLAETYLQNADWQRAVPDALRPENHARLRTWLRSHLGVAPPWLEAAVIPSIAPLRPLGINVLGHFCYPSGLQELALGAVRAAESADLGFSPRDVPAGPGRDLLDRRPYLGQEEYPYSLFCLGAEPGIAACYPLAGLAPRPGTYRIAAGMWELEAVPPEWAERTRGANEFWAYTRFIADAMRRVLPIPVVPMLPGVELRPFAPRPRSYFGLPEQGALFLFVFDMNSVMERKNPLGLIEAFRRAFRPGESAHLAIKVSRGSSDPAGMERLSRAAGEAGVTLLDAVLSRDEAYAVMACCDCYVSLHRSEGLGLTMAEAMLLGKPVIATNYSGNVDFMTAENCLLVDYRRVAITVELPSYPRGSVWAEPSVEQAATWMRWVHEHAAEARLLGERARTDAGRQLSYRAAGQRMRTRLEEIGFG